ncbi:MAG: endonuclease Q family protein [Patescibacteria group bacterium]
MRFIADFHIHSHYSRATSKEMNIVSLTKWSQMKGINVVGTGDFTHPRWFEELREKLEPAEPGLYKLKKEYEADIQKEVPPSCRVPMRFICSVEISTIYKKNDKVRKVHSLLLAPSLENAARINAELQKIGNLKADGRPILGLDTKKLLEIVLDVSEENFFIPAHIWTPHFSVFGSQSGFDTLEECFEELTSKVTVIETGLSSDPAMNWRIGELDNLAIISNSDAHSAGKLGREANVFNTELNYKSITDAMRGKKPELEYTIEFYPEEGKYHLDGHRDCGTRMEPKETKEKNFLCPKCGKKVTVGVAHRVEALANYEEGRKPEGARPFKHIIPLPEIIAEVVGTGVASKKVQAVYMEMLQKIGNDFYILLDAPLEKIKAGAGEKIAEAIQRMREGRVYIEGGYDGEYGKVHIWGEGEKKAPQRGLF